MFLYAYHAGIIIRDAKSRVLNRNIRELGKRTVLLRTVLRAQDLRSNLIHRQICICQLAGKIAERGDFDHRVSGQLALDPEIELLRIPDTAAGVEERN